MKGYYTLHSYGDVLAEHLQFDEAVSLMRDIAAQWESSSPEFELSISSEFGADT